VGFGLLRMIPGGRTLYPPLVNLLDFAVRVGTRSARSRQRKVLVTSGRLAGTKRLQPPQRLARVTLAEAATAPDPRKNHACAPRPSPKSGFPDVGFADQDEKEYSPS